MKSDECRADRFAIRAYLVRLEVGLCRPRVFLVPGRIEPRSWRFAGGVAVTDYSLSDALLKAHEMARDVLSVPA
jgi:hypothetical protein